MSGGGAPTFLAFGALTSDPLASGGVQRGLPLWLFFRRKRTVAERFAMARKYLDDARFTILTRVKTERTLKAISYL
jgi:hypothetical protein